MSRPSEIPDPRPRLARLVDAVTFKFPGESLAGILLREAVFRERFVRLLGQLPPGDRAQELDRWDIRMGTPLRQQIDAELGDPAAGPPPPDPPDSDLLTPDSSYRYSRGFRLGDKIGKGASGVVYRARRVIAPAGDDDIAVKVLAHEASATLSQLAEEDSLALFRHPGVVRVLTSGKSDRGPFIAYELVPGASLDQWLAAHPAGADSTTAARVVAALADAVAAVHARGIIHQDIKPSNVLGCQPGPLNPSGVKLGDFGTSRWVNQAGAVTGTVGYMAPEQLAGRGDTRSDVFALGMVLVRLLCRGWPPPGAGVRFHQIEAEIRNGFRPPADELQRHYREALDPERLTDGITDPVLRQIARTALAPDPAARYQSAAHLAADLTRWVKDFPTTKCGYPYTPAELRDLRRRRCERDGREYEADHLRLWARAMLFVLVPWFAVVGVVLPACWNLLAGGDPGVVNVIASHLVIWPTVGVAGYVMWRYRWRAAREWWSRRWVRSFRGGAAARTESDLSPVGQMALYSLCYCAAGGCAALLVIPDDVSRVTPVMAIIGSTACLFIGIGSPAWAHLRPLGFLLLFGLALPVSFFWPDNQVLTKLGSSVVTAMYIAFCTFHAWHCLWRRGGVETRVADIERQDTWDHSTSGGGPRDASPEGGRP